MAKPRLVEEGEVALPFVTEPKVLARDDGLGADGAQELVGELARLQTGDIEGELDDERLGDSQLRQQLQPALEGHQQLDPVSEGGARMRVEREDRRLGPGVEERLDDAAVPEMNAVEGPERDRPRTRIELAGPARDLHESSARASAGSMIRSGSASATSKGPTLVLRRLMQWPPSASAIART